MSLLDWDNWDPHLIQVYKVMYVFISPLPVLNLDESKE